MNFLQRLFAPRYTPWQFVETIEKEKEIMEQVEDTRYSHGYGISDPLDVKSVGTGKFYTVHYDVYVRHHLKTNAPQFKKFKRP